MTERPPAQRRLIGVVALVLGAGLLVFGIIMLSNGEDSGRTRYSGVVLGAGLVIVGIVELVRSARTGRS